MDWHKLKIDKFDRIKTINLPDWVEVNFLPDKSDPHVIIYYINDVDDVEKFVNTCLSENLPKDNRTIMVYEKGRKDGVNRGSIVMPFKDGTYSQFKLKAPMLCSLSEKLSAFVLCKVI